MFNVDVRICCLVVITLVPANLAYDKEMTIYVEPGKKDCFFQSAVVGNIIDIEYQVIDGGHGDLDVSFALLDPIGLVIVSDYKKSENIHRHEIRKSGDYRICFDNSFSSFNRKTVFFELMVENDGKEWQEEVQSLTPEENHVATVQEIMDYIGRIRNQLSKARQIQDLIRSYEARDRNLAEANFNKVNTWSLFQICAMLIVGLLQVFMLRSIFETGTRMSRFWQKLNELILN